MKKRLIILSLMTVNSIVFGDIMVSNLGGDGSPWNITESDWVGGSFTTGASDYNLNSISFELYLSDHMTFEPTPAESVPVVSLYTGSGGPGTLVGDLEWASYAGGIAVFTNSIALTASTEYWLVKKLEGSGAYTSVDYFVSEIEPQPRFEDAGWSINDSGLISDNSGASWQNNEYRLTAFVVDATVIPEPASLLLLLGSASGIVFWRRIHRR